MKWLLPEQITLLGSFFLLVEYNQVCDQFGWIQRYLALSLVLFKVRFSCQCDPCFSLPDWYSDSRRTPPVSPVCNHTTWLPAARKIQPNFCQVREGRMLVFSLLIERLAKTVIAFFFFTYKKSLTWAKLERLPFEFSWINCHLLDSIVHWRFSVGFGNPTFKWQFILEWRPKNISDSWFSNSPPPLPQIIRSFCLSLLIVKSMSHWVKNMFVWKTSTVDTMGCCTLKWK